MPPSDLSIRAEAPADAAPIAALTRAAFAGQPYSSQTEAFIVDALRRAGALSLSLVAEDKDGGIVGHIAFSPVTISDGTPHWYGLGPLSVAPALQRRGIGQALVRRGLARLRTLGAAGCVLLGDPAYYGRFGFRQEPGLRLPGVPGEYFQALLTDGPLPGGTVAYHPGFQARG
ncbi:GNAT family N-acetyltransferase [Roseateles violae]|uniref:N-acetyltransferase n=1 Tax=Roseateles violae TaxID=3058042 RepID=A0ABT8DYM7_9BURK|nr:N-acetyltransferase [Pelomonas sp. PFR6]MDN3922679.1 N-acetyltransferase [Pelomonas sp. PFR6]